jgi:hypothetical protein
MPVHLTRAQIDVALPRVATGLAQYQWLQQQFATNANAHTDSVFRRRFNHFYRVRRNAVWRTSYFSLMGRARQETLQFHAVLDALRTATNRLEASFASKLIATINPALPVIDKFVLRNVGLRLPAQNIQDRTAAIIRVHSSLQASFHAYLQSEDGQYLVREFNKYYPNAGVTEVKMLDLVLWQTRA